MSGLKWGADRLAELVDKEPDDILAEGTNLRLKIVNKILEDQNAINDIKALSLVRGLLKDIDSQVQNDKKIKSDDTQATNDREFARALFSKFKGEIYDNVKNMAKGSEVSEKGKVPTLDLNMIPNYKPVDREQFIGIETVTYDEFKERAEAAIDARRQLEDDKEES